MKPIKPWPTTRGPWVDVKSLPYLPMIQVIVEYGNVADARIGVELTIDEACDLRDRLDAHIKIKNSDAGNVS